jgi:hypothetical protein
MSVSYCLDGASPTALEAMMAAFQELKAFSVAKIDGDETRAMLSMKPPADGTVAISSEKRTRFAKQLVLETLELIDQHMEQAIQPLCAALRKESLKLVEATHRMSVAVRRRVHFAASCALADATKVLRDESSSIEKGDLIVSLFENLPTIIQVYCPDSRRLQGIFCDGLHEFYLGTLQPPETYEELRQRLSVFLFSWLNCCSQQLLFH